MVNECPLRTQEVLVTCQSLAVIDYELIGDPLEKAALSASGWTLTKGTHSLYIQSLWIQDYDDSASLFVYKTLQNTRF